MGNRESTDQDHPEQKLGPEELLKPTADEEANGDESPEALLHPTSDH